MIGDKERHAREDSKEFNIQCPAGNVQLTSYAAAQRFLGKFENVFHWLLEIPCSIFIIHLEYKIDLVMLGGMEFVIINFECI